MDSKTLCVMLPNGSTNATSSNRTNLAEFLDMGRICPIGYGPGERNPLPWLPGAPGLRISVGRPQNMPTLAAEGAIDAFVCFQDVVWEAWAAGLRCTEEVVLLPFSSVDVVVVVRDNSPFADLGSLLSRASRPIRCAAELPFLAAATLQDDDLYRARFGASTPALERHKRTLAGSCEAVRIMDSAGTSEVLVRDGSYACAVVVKSTGRTLQECGLRVIHTIGTYHPALFCRARLGRNSALAERLAWLVERLRLALARWNDFEAHQQLELPLS